MSDLFLILHKVRGEAAFDIATRCDDMGCPSDPGPWWIIPTSGHRAYPYQTWDLQDLRDVGDINKWGHSLCPIQYINTIPEGWPDHYPDRPSPTAPRIAGGLLRILGLGKAKEFRRRKF